MGHWRYLFNNSSRNGWCSILNMILYIFIQHKLFMYFVEMTRICIALLSYWHLWLGGAYRTCILFSNLAFFGRINGYHCQLTFVEMFLMHFLRWTWCIFQTKQVSMCICNWILGRALSSPVLLLIFETSVRCFSPLICLQVMSHNHSIYAAILLYNHLHICCHFATRVLTSLSAILC